MKNSRPTPSSEVYLAAAELIETEEACGCCAAIIESGGKPDAFEALFKPKGAGEIEYWMGRCVHIGGEENIPFRVLAMCFMDTLTKAGAEHDQRTQPSPRALPRARLRPVPRREHARRMGIAPRRRQTRKWRAGSLQHGRMVRHA